MFGPAERSTSGCVTGLGWLSGSEVEGEGKLGRMKVKTSWCLVVVRVTCVSDSRSGETVLELGSALRGGGVLEAGLASGCRRVGRSRRPYLIQRSRTLGSHV